MDRIFDALQERLPRIQKNISLKDFGTFHIGGPAEYFLIATTKEEVLLALSLAQELHVKFFIIGGGSNLLVSDKGVKGLVVKMFPTASKISGFSVETKELPKNISLKNATTVEAYAGVGMNELVSFTISHSLKGVEWAGGLPGTLGGAIRGNAGAFGGEIKDCIISVEALDEKLTVRNFSYDECKFSYRSSIFKEKSLPILSAEFKLTKAKKEELITIAQSRINYRLEKHPLEYPNVGSIFKGVAFESIPTACKGIFQDKVKNDPFPVVPAAWFIIEAGLTGTTVGKAQFSEKHANYIINLGGATSDDVLKLIDCAQKTVREKFNIDLEVEVQYVE